MSTAETAQSKAQKRLFFDAYALIASTVISAGAGLITYSLASKVFHADVLARAVTMSSAMLLISGIAQLDLTHVLHRYLPQSNRSAAGRLIVGSYAVSAVVSLVLAALFVVIFGEPIFGSDRSFAVLWFSLAVMAWSLFTLQDQVLMGLGAAWVVPIENTLHGIARIALIVMFSIIGGSAVAIFSTWVLPVVVLLIAVSILIATKALPDHAARVAPDAPGWDVGTAARFAGGGYVGTLSSLTLANLLPLLVNAHLRGGAAAYFQIPWMLSSVVDLVALNFGASLVVQGAAHREHIPHLLRSAFRRQVVVLVPCLVVLAVLAHPILVVVGKRSYADAAATMLTLLAIGLIPRLVWGVYLPAVRLAGNVKAIAISQTLSNVAVLIATIAGLYLGGLTGIGVGYGSAQLVIVIIVAPKLWRMLRADSLELASTDTKAANHVSPVVPGEKS